MTHEAFVDTIVNSLNGKDSITSRGITVSARKVTNTKKTYYGAVAATNKTPVTVSLDLDEEYEAYKFGKELFASVDDVAEAIINNIENVPVIDWSIDFSDYNSIKERLFIRVRPGDKISEKYVSRKWEDLYLTYSFDVGEEGATAPVTYEMLKRFGISLSQLHNDALENMSEKFPFSIKSISEVMADMMGVPADSFPDTGLYVATCHDNVIGAGCMFMDGFLEAATKAAGGDFLILPSSTHEVLISPVRSDLTSDELRSIVRDINAGVVAEEDRLSNNVYRFNAATGKLAII